MRLLGIEITALGVLEKCINSSPPDVYIWTICYCIQILHNEELRGDNSCNKKVVNIIQNCINDIDVSFYQFQGLSGLVLTPQMTFVSIEKVSTIGPVDNSVFFFQS